MKTIIGRLRVFLILSIYIVSLFSSAEASDNFFLGRKSLPPAIQLQLVASGLQNPVLVTHARDNRLFIVEQNGRIRIFQHNQLLPAPFLDISSLMVCCGEQGFLGLAFHPAYPATPYFYVHFTSSGAALPDGTTPTPGANLLVRYEVSGNPNLANAASGKLVLEMPQPFQNHNGGMIEFGPDGYLYIAKGDGGSQNDPNNRAQNINVLNGKILRLDVNQNINAPPYHAIPPTNPFAGATPGADEIFLIGFRNPWRFSFDRATGDLWIGDVGQGQREEIDRVVLDASAPGKNFGWRAYEGTLCTNLSPQQCAGGANPIAHTPPVAEYAHTGGRCSITGGYVYRGSQISSLHGSYVYADYCTGEIFRFVDSFKDGTVQELLLDTSHNISSFGEDQSGELYITAISGNVYRIQGVAAAPLATIAGRVTRADGRGAGGVRLILTGGTLTEPRIVQTNPFGYYRFAGVPTGLDYVVTPSSKRYRSFVPAALSFNLTEERLNADFTVGN